MTCRSVFCYVDPDITTLPEAPTSRPVFDSEEVVFMGREVSASGPLLLSHLWVELVCATRQGPVLDTQKMR